MKLFFIVGLISFTSLSAQVKKPVAKKAPVISSAMKAQASNEKLVEITTPYGIMVARLYDATPLHRDNFSSKVKAGFYDSLLFHRVIREFMIQGGDPTSKNAAIDATLGSGSAPGDRISAEFKPSFFHKKGALAAARDGNPEKASSNCQFYIVQGRPTDTTQLNASITYSKSQKEIYQRIGGTPNLDQNYTVFGEVISGLDVIDKIAAAPTKPGDRPIENVWMKVRLLN